MNFMKINSTLFNNRSKRVTHQRLKARKKKKEKKNQK
jgi:hypothetical protein